MILKNKVKLLPIIKRFLVIFFTFNMLSLVAIAGGKMMDTGKITKSIETQLLGDIKKIQLSLDPENKDNALIQDAYKKLPKAKKDSLLDKIQDEVVEYAKKSGFNDDSKTNIAKKDDFNSVFFAYMGNLDSFSKETSINFKSYIVKVAATADADNYKIHLVRDLLQNIHTKVIAEKDPSKRYVIDLSLFYKMNKDGTLMLVPVLTKEKVASLIEKLK